MKIKKNMLEKDIHGCIAQNKQQFCNLHNQQCDLVCLNDGKKICYNCALFGCHKGHDVQTAQKLVQQLSQYKSKLSVISQNIKQVKFQKTKNLKFKECLREVQKQKISKIKQSFHGLAVQLRIKQKQCILKIQKQYNKIEEIVNKQQQKLSDYFRQNQQQMRQFQKLEYFISQSVLQGRDWQNYQMFLKQQKRAQFLQIVKEIQFEYETQCLQLQKYAQKLVNSIQVKIQCASSKSIFIQNWCQIQNSCPNLKNKEYIYRSNRELSIYDQNSQLYLLSSVQSIENISNYSKYGKQISQEQDQQYLLNSLKTSQIATSENICNKPMFVQNVECIVLQEIPNDNLINTKLDSRAKANQISCTKNIKQALNKNQKLYKRNN